MAKRATRLPAVEMFRMFRDGEGYVAKSKVATAPKGFRLGGSFCRKLSVGRFLSDLRRFPGKRVWIFIGYAT